MPEKLQPVPMQIDEYIEQLCDRFEAADLTYAHGTDNAWDEAVYLVFCTLGLDFDDTELPLQRQLGEDELRLLERRARQRMAERIPVAYLVGQAWFAGQVFNIDPRALIPRSPIGELIERHLEPLLQNEPATILDLCTGSGCIGIACALEFPAARVDLADLSRAALELAATNVQRYELQPRVRLLQSDLFAAIPDRYDLILCNPPYVAESIVAGLAAEFSREPREGLLSADEGLAIPLQILAEAADHLTEAGVLVLEVGCAAEALQRRFPQLPFLWLEFERGGDGVLALTAAQLQKYRAAFN